MAVIQVTVRTRGCSALVPSADREGCALAFLVVATRAANGMPSRQSYGARARRRTFLNASWAQSCLTPYTWLDSLHANQELNTILSVVPCHLAGPGLESVRKSGHADSCEYLVPRCYTSDRGEMDLGAIACLRSRRYDLRVQRVRARTSNGHFPAKSPAPDSAVPSKAQVGGRSMLPGHWQPVEAYPRWHSSGTASLPAWIQATMFRRPPWVRKLASMESCLSSLVPMKRSSQHQV